MKISAEMCNVFYRFWYLPSNGTSANVVLHHVDLDFQGQVFSCYAFAIKIAQRQRMSPGRFASTRTASAVKLLLSDFLSITRDRWFVHRCPPNVLLDESAKQIRQTRLNKISYSRNLVSDLYGSVYVFVQICTRIFMLSDGRNSEYVRIRLFTYISNIKNPFNQACTIKFGSALLRKIADGLICRPSKYSCGRLWITQRNTVSCFNLFRHRTWQKHRLAY